MSVEFDIAGLSNRLSQRMARRLLAVAITFQSEARGDYSIGNPDPHKNPSRPGEFPKLRTGNLRSAISVETTDLNQIAREKKVRVGIRKNAEYGFYLRMRGWKGLGDVLRRCRAKLAAIMASGTRK